MKNALRECLVSGGSAIGTVCVIGSIESVEITCASGFDYVLIDGQHGSFTQASMREALRAVDAAGGHAVARPAAPIPHLIEPLLDMGYLSLLVPMVDTPEQASQVARAAHYPPLGARSQATTRASIHHGADYRKRFNDELFVIAMIETEASAANIAAIAGTPGVHSCFIGSTDLASSMGVDPSDARYGRTIESILAATLDAGKVPAIAAGSLDSARRFLDQGFRMLTYRSDARMLADGCREAMMLKSR